MQSENGIEFEPNFGPLTPVIIPVVIPHGFSRIFITSREKKTKSVREEVERNMGRRREISDWCEALMKKANARNRSESNNR